MLHMEGRGLPIVTRRTTSIILFFFIIPVSGCAFKASDDECLMACENVAKVGHSELERQIEETEDLAASGEGGKTMARNMASAMMDAIEDECLKQCKEKGSRKQADCLVRVKSVEELNKCI
jgi:hypothetical protein